MNPSGQGNEPKDVQSEALAGQSASPRRVASQKPPLRPGSHFGPEDRRNILDSPVLLPLMTVRPNRLLIRESCAIKGLSLNLCYVSQEEPSPTTGISLPAGSVVRGLEAGAQAFAAARGGPASTKGREVRTRYTLTMMHRCAILLCILMLCIPDLHCCVLCGCPEMSGCRAL